MRKLVVVSGNGAIADCIVSFNITAEVFAHLFQGLLVNVVNKSNTYKLANCAEHIKTCNEPAEVSGCLSRLTDGTEFFLVTNQGSTHNGDNSSGANTLCELTEEGVQCVNNAFFSLAGFLGSR